MCEEMTYKLGSTLLLAGGTDFNESRITWITSQRSMKNCTEQIEPNVC